MKLKYSFIAIFIIVFFSRNNVSYAQDKTDTTYYSNKRIKEIADWNNGLIVGKRKFFKKNTRLAEEHIFLQKDVKYNNGIPYWGKGIIKTYYPDGHNFASIIPVEQEVVVVDEKRTYKIKIPANSVVKGYRKKGEEKLFEYTIAEEIVLSYNEKENSFFLDPYVENEGLTNLNADIVFFDKYGVVESRAKITNGTISGVRKSFYPNNQLKSEGVVKKIGGTEYRVGEWKFYYQDGTLEKELTYYGGESSKVYIPWGKLVKVGKYYFPNGKLKYLIHYPEYDDDFLRTDTIEVYYPTEKDQPEQLKSKFYLDKHVQMFELKSKRRDRELEQSALYVEYYPDGKLKKRGFYLMTPPRKKIETEEDLILEAIADIKKQIKVGTWYYFDKDENIIKAERYQFLTGNLKGKKGQFKEKDIIKINKEFQLNKKKYSFEELIEYDQTKVMQN